MIFPGSTLGMLGGGQLGRMFTIAARTMGYHVVVLDPDPDSPAGRIADEHLHAAFTDDWALEQLTSVCDVVTTEFENIPAATLRQLESKCLVHPSARVLEITQDRINEKRFIRECGLATAPFYVIEVVEDLIGTLTGSMLLKRSSLGYDGKGQVRVDNLDSAKQAFRALGNVPCVLEQFIDLDCEISVVLGRRPNGETRCFPIAQNEHRNGILFMSVVPAAIDDRLSKTAQEMAIVLADKLGYCGVMAVEFFVTREGDLLVNEIAPRPHNSGHYTLNACVTSQFEQQVRMICDLSAGSTRLLSPVVMVNLLGDIWYDVAPDWGHLLRDPNIKLHLYGKREARPSRKMGHFCYLHTDSVQARQAATRIYKGLE